VSFTVIVSLNREVAHEAIRSDITNDNIKSLLLVIFCSKIR
jgi:hypothetical protein